MQYCKYIAILTNYQGKRLKRLLKQPYLNIPFKTDSIFEKLS